MKLGKPSEEGTCAVLVDCDCGQREIDYAEIQRILDEPWPDPFAIDAIAKQGD
jgi:hypothetical protein